MILFSVWGGQVCTTVALDRAATLATAPARRVFRVMRYAMPAAGSA